MLTYRVRPRVLRLTGACPAFPAAAEAQFRFSPGQIFGTEAGGGRTAVMDSLARMEWDANAGKFTITNNPPLKPLSVEVESGTRRVWWEGSVLHVAQLVDSIEALNSILHSVYFALPMILNASMADPPIVERVAGVLADVPFSWELSRSLSSFKTTSDAHQSEQAILAWTRWQALGEDNGQRLLAALHYFHVATRLSRVSSTPGEFLSECVLNLAKVLEVLFPPAGDGLTRAAARKGLTGLGFTDGEIERHYIPSMLFRNEIDSGHVHLGLFTSEQLQVIHAYVDGAEMPFKELMNRVLTRFVAGDWTPADYMAHPVSPRVVTIIGRLGELQQRGGPQTD